MAMDRIRKAWAVGAAAASLAMATLPLGAHAAEGYVHFDWQSVADGVWVGISKPGSYQTGNTVIISLPGQGSMVVDSQLAPYMGQEIVEKVKELGVAPVRYLVNTHLHQDHVGGNIAFRKAYPKVEIIAHSATCRGVEDKTKRQAILRVPRLSTQADQLMAKRAGLAAGDPEIAGIDRMVAGIRLYLEDAKNFEWVMPEKCLDFKPGQQRVIQAGGRRIEIKHVGGSHSAGDLIVWLPKEKVVAVGDIWSTGGDFLLNSGIDGRDGSVVDAPKVQKAIAALPFEVAIPGHRAVVRGRESLNTAIANSEKFVAQVKAVWDRSEFVDDAIRQVTPPVPQLNPAWQRAVIRAYEEIEQRRQRGLSVP